MIKHFGFVRNEIAFWLSIRSVYTYNSYMVNINILHWQCTCRNCLDEMKTTWKWHFKSITISLHNRNFICACCWNLRYRIKLLLHLIILLYIILILYILILPLEVQLENHIYIFIIYVTSNIQTISSHLIFFAVTSNTSPSVTSFNTAYKIRMLLLNNLYEYVYI